MKTFEDKILELNEWYFAERDKITAMNIPREGGLDGGDTPLIWNCSENIVKGCAH